MTEYKLGEEVIGERERARLVKIACHLLHDRNDVEDVVQSVLLKTWARRHQFRGDSTVMTWLSASVKNEAFMYMRRNVYRCERVQLDEIHTRNLADCGIAIERELSMRAELRRILKVLPAKLREVLVLADADRGRAAEALHLTRSNFKTRLHRARMRVRRLSGAPLIEGHLTKRAVAQSD
jgi:RNA polymerase sigma-70 factor (ECF subfamily)